MIRIENLHLRYKSESGEVYAARGVSLAVKPGQFYTLLGPSGCGKTTTLRSLAGLETPQQGEIAIDDTIVFSSSKGIFIPPYKRDIGMVFQSYAIWPHMNVFENVAFPLKEMKGRFSRQEIRAKVCQALALVQLEGLEERPAPFLSGGQQQRLALARALVKEPRVLLLDEPLSNLDAKLREETRLEIRALVKRLGITTLYVTHDQLEALTMSDLIAVMDQGRIVQEGTPKEIYQTPRERFVASFIGLTNCVEGKVKKTDGKDIGEVETASGMLRCVLPQGAAVGDSVVVMVRPEDIHILDRNGARTQNFLEGQVEALVFLGEALECHVAVGNQRVRLRLHPTSAVQRGDTVRMELPAERCLALRG